MDVFKRVNVISIFNGGNVGCEKAYEIFKAAEEEARKTSIKTKHALELKMEKILATAFEEMGFEWYVVKYVKYAIRKEKTAFPYAARCDDDIHYKAIMAAYDILGGICDYYDIDEATVVAETAIEFLKDKNTVNEFRARPIECQI